jgi:hypothetical protein
MLRWSGAEVLVWYNAPKRAHSGATGDQTDEWLDAPLALSQLLSLFFSAAAAWPVIGCSLYTDEIPKLLPDQSAYHGYFLSI